MEHASQRRLRLQARILAVIALALAGACITLAVAWRSEHRAAECWRTAFEDDEIPAAGRCP